MKLMIKVFIEDLARYDCESIASALRQWRHVSHDFPTPADIVKIIIPPKEKISNAAYVSAQKRKESSGGYYYDNSVKDAKLIAQYEADEYKKTETKGEDYIAIGKSDLCGLLEDKR